MLVTRGWGMFEAIEMCEAMGIEPIVTLNSNETQGDLGDLVEYLFATTESPWGQLRVQDGHSQPYRVQWFEIGNECKTQDFVGKAMAMEKRARSFGLGGTLKYISPGSFGNGAEVMASAMARELGSQLYLDIHTSKGEAKTWGSGRSLQAGRDWTSRLRALNSSARLVVLETNTARHDFSRVIFESSDLNDLQRYGRSEDVRIDLRVESFCMEKSGHDPALDARHKYIGDQGAIFFLQNQTYGQPPYFVHRMVQETSQPLVLDFTSSSTDDTLNIYAGRSRDGRTVVIRIANEREVARSVLLKLGQRFDGAFIGENTLNVTVLTSGGDMIADNPPWDPERYSPSTSSILSGGPGGTRIRLPPLSFTVATAHALEFSFGSRVVV